MVEPTENKPKGELNSTTIRNALYMLGVNGITWAIGHEQEISATLTGLFPLMLQPFIPPIASALIAIANIWFTSRVITGRKAVGDIHGLYTKQK